MNENIKAETGNFIEKMSEVLEKYWDKFLFHLPKVLIGITIIVVAIFIAAKISQFLSTRFQHKAKDPLLLDFLSRIVKYVLIITGIMIAMQIIGFTGIASGLLAGAGISAFIIGFAFKDIGENFLAGIILAFNRPFRIKDTIKVKDMIGKVMTLNLRTTVIKTFDGKDIYIPNSIILKEPLSNFTRDGLNRHEFIVNIGVEYDVDEVSAVIIDSIKPVEGIVKERPPFVVIEELKNNGIDLKVYFWIYTYDFKKRTNVIKSDVIKAVKNALIKSGYIKSPKVEEKEKEEEKELKPAEKVNDEKKKQEDSKPADSYKIADNDKGKNS